MSDVPRPRHDVKTHTDAHLMIHSSASQSVQNLPAEYLLPSMVSRMTCVSRGLTWSLVTKLAAHNKRRNRLRLEQIPLEFFLAGRMSSKILFSSLLIWFQSVPLPICLSNNFTNKYRKNNEIIFLTLLSCKKEVEKIRGLPDFLFGCNCCHAPRLIRGEARLSAGVCPDGQQFSRLWAQTSSVGFWLRHRKDLPHPVVY